MERTGESPSGVTSMRRWTRPRTSRQMASRSRAGNSSVENRNGTASPLVAVIYPSGLLSPHILFGTGFFTFPDMLGLIRNNNRPQSLCRKIRAPTKISAPNFTSDICVGMVLTIANDFHGCLTSQQLSRREEGPRSLHVPTNLRRVTSLSVKTAIDACGYAG